MEVSGEAADLVMKEGVQISEEAIKLLARGAKNLAALLYALAKDQKKLYGMVGMNRLLSEQRPIEVLPLRTEDFDDFKQRAKKSACCSLPSWTKKRCTVHRNPDQHRPSLTGKLYLGADGVSAEAVGGYAAKKAQTPVQPEPSLQKAKEWLDAGDDFDQ